MGYTHGTKWTEEQIVEGILGVKNALGTDYMPSKSKMLTVTGNNLFPVKISRKVNWALEKQVNTTVIKIDLTIFKSI